MFGGIANLLLICLALYGAGELLLKPFPSRSVPGALGGASRQANRDAQFDLTTGTEAPCPWPRLEPEVEQLRAKGAL